MHKKFLNDKKTRQRGYKTPEVSEKKQKTVRRINMLTLPKIFSDNALFLQDAPLDIRGSTDNGAAVKVTVSRNGEIFSSGESVADGSGNFTVRVHTPKASFDEWCITVSADNGSAELNGILFGELWFACGQSNMEMPNHQQPEWNDVYNIIKDKKIRSFDAPRLAANADHPVSPVSDTDGWWVNADDKSKMSNVSALATAFSDELYDFLNACGDNVPVGFLNCNHGGTCIETWIPHESFDKYPKIAYKGPELENWNKKGEGNYQQPGAHYNYNTYPHLGVKAKGMLWYQGESNLGAEQTQHIYKDLLIALRESYKERFAVNGEATFPMISSLIYPWKYWNHDESNVGYLNKCFTDLAKDHPKLYPFIPICDLSPIWTYHLGNHPIHPAHKYAIGKRFAKLCLAEYYGKDDPQPLPPTLRSCVRHGDKLRLTFDNVGKGLYVDGGRIRGLYVRSDKSAYVPAKCEIVGKRVMNVWNDHLNAPKYVAYAVSSHEAATNLYAGEYPVTPFCTEFDKNGVTTAIISRKPWLDMKNDSEFVVESNFSDQYRNAGCKPIYYPSDGTVICYDTFYSRSGRSLRIEGKSSVFGAYVLSKPGAALDLGNYSALNMSVYNGAQNTARLILYYKEEKGTAITFSVNGSVVNDIGFGWQEISFDLSAIPTGCIEKMEFSFKHTAGKVPFVNIDDLDINPKN